MRLGLDGAFGFALRATVTKDFVRACFGLLGFWAALAAAMAAPEAALSGKVVDESGAAISGAHVLLSGPVAAGQLVVRTDAAGQFSLPSIAPGSYHIEVLHEGFFPLRQQIEVAREGIHLELALARQQVKQTVDVIASIQEVDPQQTSRTRTITQEQIDRVPFTPAYDFQKALAILPGVATDNLGRLHINGGATDQITFLLDGFNITSPVAGGLENNFSVDSVRAADVRSSRYSAEYGKASSGVVAVTTHSGDDRFRYKVTDFIPSFDNQGGVYLKDWAPRATVSGPLVKNRVWFLNSFDAKYDLDVLSGLPKGGDRTSAWRWSDLVRLQAQLGPSHLLAATWLHNDASYGHVGLDLLNPVETTRDIRLLNNFFSLKDQGYWKGMLIDAGVAVNRLHLRKDPMGDLPFIIEPDRRRGNYFMRSNRQAERQQYMANFAPQPLYAAGRHDVKFGLNLDRIFYRSLASRRSYQTLRERSVPWRLTTFSGEPGYTRNNLEWSGYVQDRWSPVSRFLVEMGLRHDWDEVVGRQLVSPRLAFTVVPWAGKDIKLSGGVGVFYDATNLYAVTRPLDQRQFDTFFHPDGSYSWGPAETVFRADFGHLRAPRVVNWSAGWEQRFPGGFLVRANFLQKRGVRGFTFQNLLRANTAALLAVYELQNTRRDRYNSFEMTVNQALGDNTRWSASYVRSAAHTSAVLDYTIENPFFTGQGAGPMDWDIPNRLLGHGWAPLPGFKKYTVSWFVEWRDGTPFSVINDRQELVGSPNRLRLPRYFSLNPHIEREVETGRYRWSFRVGVNNVTGHGNYSFVNNNTASPRFLNYAGGQRRSLTFRIRYLGRSK